MNKELNLSILFVIFNRKYILAFFLLLSFIDMEINKNIQYSIVRKMLILTVLGVFLISQNIAGII